MSEFIVCSYFTAGTGYEKEALNLEASIILNKIEPYFIQRISNLGNWRKNVFHKPKLIKMMMKKHPDLNIVFTDADSQFHSYPELFKKINADFACHFRNWHAKQGELLSGTLFVKNSNKMMKIIDEWIETDKHNHNVNQPQRNLERVIRKNSHKISIYRLPIEYCCIFDDENRRKIRPVIEHFQASRRFRRTT